MKSICIQHIPPADLQSLQMFLIPGLVSLDWQQLVEEFFNLSDVKKTKYSYSGVADNLGYSGITEERLNPNKPGDLKEAFNWKSPDKMKDQYWPEEIPEFKPLAQKILRISQLLSLEFLYRFENILKLPKGRFVESTWMDLPR